MVTAIFCGLLFAFIKNLGLECAMSLIFVPFSYMYVYI